MFRKSFEYFDYEPSEHALDGTAVMSALVMLGLILAALIVVY